MVDICKSVWLHLILGHDVTKFFGLRINWYKGLFKIIEIKYSNQGIKAYWIPIKISILWKTTWLGKMNYIYREKS